MERYISMAGVVLVLLSGVYSTVRSFQEGIFHGMMGLLTGSMVSSIRCWRQGDKLPLIVFALGLLLLFLGVHLAERI